MRKCGISLRRFKTGTPARVNSSSIDFSKMILQEGDKETIPFSFMGVGEKVEDLVPFNKELYLNSLIGTQ